MVRVNLLPDRKLTKTRAGGASVAEPGQLWILAVLGVVVLEIVVLVFVQKLQNDKLDGIIGENAKVQGQIDGIKRQISNHGDIKAQLKQLRDREEAISKLESARKGPTAVMLELSRVLTPGKGPTTDRDKLEQLKRDNPAAVFNTSWDPRRLWLTSYQEVERTVKIDGLAKDADDVSELQRRLLLSDYFYDVSLLPGSKVIDDKTKTELVKFQLSAKVRY